MTQLTVAALQLALASPDPADNIAAVAAQVEAAAAQGAQVILPPELFAGPYFCVTEDEARFALAHTLEEDASVKAMQRSPRRWAWQSPPASSSAKARTTTTPSP
jgi:N-carbamoylputrescine amidase